MDSVCVKVRDFAGEGWGRRGRCGSRLWGGVAGRRRRRRRRQDAAALQARTRPPSERRGLGLPPSQLGTSPRPSLSAQFVPGAERLLQAKQFLPPSFGPAVTAAVSGVGGGGGGSGSGRGARASPSAQTLGTAGRGHAVGQLSQLEAVAMGFLSCWLRISRVRDSSSRSWQVLHTSTGSYSCWSGIGSFRWQQSLQNTLPQFLQW